MNLKKYDGKCVQIKCVDGKTYEGYCEYNSWDYCFHEFGRNEDCLQILCLLFYKDDIEKIKSIEKHRGPYGKFSEAFGDLEKEIVNEGADLIDEVFESEENEHIMRLLLCLENRTLDNDILVLLQKLMKYNEDEKIIKKAKELINKSEINENNYA